MSVIHKAKPTKALKPTLQPQASSEFVDAADDARTRILDATHCLVGEKGFEATSIRDIARVSGANPALVYYYYGSKEGLFTALANHNADRAGAILREAADLDGSTRERVRHFLLKWMQAVCQPTRPIAPWFRQAIQAQDAHGEQLRERVAGNISILTGILEKGIENGQLRKPDIATTTIATGIMMSVAGQAMEVLLPHSKAGIDLTTDESRTRFVDGMLEVWFNGLGLPASTKRKR